MVFLLFTAFMPRVAMAENEVLHTLETDQTNCENMGSGFLPGDYNPDFFRRLVEKKIPGEELLIDFSSPFSDITGDQVEWTFLFYDDSDFTGYKPFTSFCDEAYSSENVKVLVLRDPNTGPASLWYVHESSSPVFLEDWGEVNMGDWETLYNFIMWGKANYPADRYMLALYDHGFGWAGACYDETSGNDFLTMEEIANAIGDAGGVDIAAFTAPCLMGALESAYELRNCVDVYIGSEESSGYAFWRGIIDEICDVLNNSSTLSNEEVSSMIIDLVESNYTGPYSEWMTMSAVDQACITGFTEPLDQLAEYMIENMDELGPNIQTARQNTWCVGMGTSYSFEIDLYDYLLQIAEIETDPFVLAKVQQTSQFFTSAIINECHGSNHERTHGLTIYFPLEAETFETEYCEMNLDFIDDTYWDEFLAAYYDWQQAGIADGSVDSNPCLSVNPNPFENTTRVTYTCPSTGNVDLAVFDISGRFVRTLAYGAVEGGTHSVSWDGKNDQGTLVPAGAYICVLNTESGPMLSTRVIILR